ncbi:unnamed protein product [Caenorhabditis angaria]|uniref:Uncharacterized protein n=1 Tax=Caenorhabditis angaria TaxID=860376 RepID=A0A9P1ICU6_9PELO|nr:unnamed protein product [Caenorhabditis angaria]
MLILSISAFPILIFCCKRKKKNWKTASSSTTNCSGTLKNPAQSATNITPTQTTPQKQKNGKEGNQAVSTFNLDVTQIDVLQQQQQQQPDKIMNKKERQSSKKVEMKKRSQKMTKQQIEKTAMATTGKGAKRSKQPSLVTTSVTQNVDTKDVTNEQTRQSTIGAEPEFLPSDHEDDTLRCVKSIRKS